MIVKRERVSGKESGSGWNARAAVRKARTASERQLPKIKAPSQINSSKIGQPMMTKKKSSTNADSPVVMAAFLSKAPAGNGPFEENVMCSCT
mmetsp:Transcript_91207/g.162435  ORF Transcript_91207/g.162435 Transcript_91207/m.162435 type:complete len:92 (-) Transcript_91207:106-381(-)